MILRRKFMVVAWDQQVMSALTELDEEIESVVNKVYEKLADGQFFPYE
jgi:hypothetical protein